MPLDVLLHCILGADSILGNRNSADGDFKPWFQAEISKANILGRWCSIIHLLALSTVLQQSITSVFPNVPSRFSFIYNSVLTPIRKVNKPKNIPSPKHDLVVFWSRTSLDTEAAYYEPNHVVPVVSEEISAKSPPPKRSKQSKINSFFSKPTTSSDSQNPVSESASEHPSSNSDNEHVEHATSSQDAFKNRKIKADWFKTYTWLKYCPESNSFHCKTCLQANEINVFTTGKDAKIPKKDDFIKHEKSKSHLSANNVLHSRKEFIKVRNSAFGHAEESMIKQMRTAYVQAKEAIPSVKHAALLRLQMLNGAQIYTGKDDKLPYQHHTSVNELYEAMAHQIVEDINKDIKDGPYKIFSIEADEATDVNNCSIVIVYVRYVNSNGNIRTRFLSVEELEATTAVEVHAGILKCLNERGLSVNNIVGMATDGASVMRGVHVGVVTKFKEANPSIVGSHCMAHRLQLASEKAAKKVPYIIKYISILNQFAKTLKYSPKLKRILENCKSLTDEKAKKIHQVFFTRWLSFSNSVEALCGCLSSVISSLSAAAAERSLEGRSMLHGIMSQMSTVKFVLMTHFLTDVMGIMGKLSLHMQKQNALHSTLVSQIEASVDAIREMKNTPGPHLSEIQNNLPPQPDGSGYCEYKSQSLKDSNKQRSDFKAAAGHFIDELLLFLQTTFPDNKILDAFLIFSPKDVRHITQDQQSLLLNDLCKHFTLHVSKEQAVEEWKMLSFIMQNARYKDSNMEQFMSLFLHNAREAYPNLSLLCAIGLTLPVTSVSCERGVSAYNIIKTDSRNQLRVQHVANLMQIYIEGPNVTDFDFKIAFDLWIENKDRKGFKAFVKQSGKKD